MIEEQVSDDPVRQQSTKITERLIFKKTAETAVAP